MLDKDYIYENILSQQYSWFELALVDALTVAKTA